ncbi:sulfate adenylyltransferase subunit CysN [Bacteroides ihuae]|uniref:sulfate adenylyltransferase subunit CysN n=1 Tax=Bacteroides ihuae TaxID=1852362 RepID=UPI000B04CD4E
MDRDTMNYIVREQELIHNDLSTYLKRHEQKEMLRLLVAGSVDDGKSTLIGRLLYDSHLIYKDHLEAIQQDSKVFNTTEDEIDLSLLTDGLRAEREQGITIDVAYRYFSTEKKSFILCDAPGHEQYTRNMATGASHCEMALILVDAQNGVKAQTRRHSLIASIMGIRNIVVVVNKMDLVSYRESIFESIRQGYLAFANKLDIDSIHFIPISALTGENVVIPSTKMSWYMGGPLLNYLENVQPVNDRNLMDFRFPVQYVIRPNAFFRGYAGSIASGIIRKGDEVIVLPSRQKTRIKSIETFDGNLEEAFASTPVVLTMENEVDISRGMVLTKPNNVPVVGNVLEAMLVWMDNFPLQIGGEYLLKCNMQCMPVRIKSVRYKYNINELTRISSENLALNDIGRVELVLQRPLIYDSFRRNKAMGAFILIDRNSNATSGGGVILDQVAEKVQEKRYLSEEKSTVTTKQREELFGHKPATVWLTGLSGSGKSTIARLLEPTLLERGVHACVLDGDNLRHGLNSDLGFSPEDRSENIRRVAEIAKLMNDAGLVVIAAFISPYEKDREEASRIIGDRMIEVYVDADIQTCMQRDPKGLYAKFAAGKFKGLTGIDAPYEVPQNSALILSTDKESVEESLGKVLEMVLEMI